MEKKQTVKTQEQINIESFLKEAFCIDGECTLSSIQDLVHSKTISTFKLMDTERGEFYITISKK